ncbi:hypothetical protein ACFQ60_17310 [Streptomyces zhihengii]
MTSAQMRERIVSSKDFADQFFLLEARRLRKVYISTGNPHLAYSCGTAVAAFGRKVGVEGSVGLALIESGLAEMLISGGTSSADMFRAERHLVVARDHLEKSRHTSMVSQALGQWYMLISICYKARRGPYEEILREAADDPWMATRASHGDRVPPARQEVMRRQDLQGHMELLEDASTYKSERPLEYYRTVKRVVEFLANRGMTDSVSRIEKEFVSAFLRVSDRTTLVGKISFAKNVAQISALKGNHDAARHILRTVRGKAVQGGLHGQIRQLDGIARAIDQGDVRGALQTFRV